MAESSKLKGADTAHQGHFRAATLLLVAACACAQSPHRIEAEGPEILITPILHSSVQIEHSGKVVHIDPWSAGDLSSAKPADLILVIDDPPHHLDPVAIEQLRKPGAPIVLTATAYAKLGEGTVLANGESGVFAGVPVEAVPAYDITPGQPWHPKGEANGYVITLGGRRICFSGVGECVPEIQALERIDVAFILNSAVNRHSGAVTFAQMAHPKWESVACDQARSGRAVSRSPRSP